MKFTKPTQKQLVILAAVIIAITAALLLILMRSHVLPYYFESDSEYIAPTDGLELIERHPLTGQSIVEPVGRPEVYGVMVENMVEAWPLSGIEQAFLVIEAPVEAAIPRFLAFYYADQEVEKIGPVRSARPYYVDWSEELEAMYVHVGGSPDALSQIGQKDIFDLNEFYRGWYFWRSTDRSAPHNVYTSTDLLAEAYEAESAWRTMGELDYGLWQFKENVLVDNRPENQFVSLNFSKYYGDLYLAGWEYCSETNDYLRYQSGYQMYMLDGAEVRANNIAILETDIVILDEIGRRQITTVGQGDALVVQDGQLVDAVWSKSSTEERLRFYNKNTG
ncbi:MAG: DUF3048 domain-containing protein, partial [Candidatus Uhrbacteria bacterium]